MVEELIGQIGGSSRILRGREKSAWNRLTHKINLVDTHEHMVGRLKYSWVSQEKASPQP